MTDPLTNDQIVDIYARHEEEIALLWVDMGEDCTMREAVEEWLRRQVEPRKETAR